MATLHVYKLLVGNQYEHVSDKDQGKDIPLSQPDDRVYIKRRGGFQPSTKKILCAQCNHVRSQCHCATPLEEVDIGARIVALQRQQGKRP